MSLIRLHKNAATLKHIVFLQAKRKIRRKKSERQDLLISSLVKVALHERDEYEVAVL